VVVMRGVVQVGVSMVWKFELACDCRMLEGEGNVGF
jgi:hypothetical protein